MPFFTDTAFEPKRQFRFTVNFSDQPELTFMCLKAGKPAYAIESTPHRFLNHEFKFPNIVKWEDITVSFVDAREPNVGFRFFNMLKQAGYELPLGQDAVFGGGITKLQSTDGIGTVRIRQLDGGAKNLASDLAAPGGAGAPLPVGIIDEWTLKNAFISAVKWGTLDYSQDGLVNVEVTLKYDFANYTINNGNLPIP